MPLVVSFAVIVARSALSGESTTRTTVEAPGARSPSAHSPAEQPAGSGPAGTVAGSPRRSRSPVASALRPLRTVYVTTTRPPT